MQAVVSLLDPPHIKLVETIWQCLENQCGLTGIRKTPFAHFSWHVAQSYDRPLGQLLERTASLAVPFQVRCVGIGLFTGPSPVLYINLVKTLAMAEFHKHLWDQVEPLAVQSSDHYTPIQWTPHITLAHSDLDPEKLSCAINELGYFRLDWQIPIDNLAVVQQSGDEIGDLLARYPFEQKES
jgi:2'-5' RNA ligase